VYDGLTAGKDQVVPDSYIAKFQPIALKRVALAAHRLAYGIEQIFGKSKTIEKVNSSTIEEKLKLIQ